MAKRVAGVTTFLFSGFLSAALSLAPGQTTAVGSTSLPIDGARNGGAPVADATQGVHAAAEDARTEKQKALAQQAEKLFDMATELKMQVDKTNKNILSMKVVEKAEEIEMLAKGMKNAGRR